MWILAPMRSSRSRSGRSSGTAQCSPLPTVCTPSWTVTASLSSPMGRWLSLVAPTSCFAKGESSLRRVFDDLFQWWGTGWAGSTDWGGKQRAAVGDCKSSLLQVQRRFSIVFSLTSGTKTIYYASRCEDFSFIYALSLSILTATSMELCQKRTAEQNFEEE